MIRHAWFDMGGTLYRETSAFQVEHDALRYQTYAKIVGEQDPNRARQGYDALYTKHGSNSAVFSSLGEPSDYWQGVFGNMDLSKVLTSDPTVKSVLKELHRYVPISLFTNFKPEKIESTLQLLDIPANIFTHILSGDDVQKRKPELEGFKKMIELSELPASELLYVGDRVDVDIKPAKAVGMRTCLVWASSDEADYSAPHFSDLVATLRPGLTAK